MEGKKDFVYTYAHKRGVTVREAQEDVEAFLEVIQDSCIKHGGVSFKGVFTLSRELRKARKGSIGNVSYDVPEHYTLKLTVGSALKEKLRSIKVN